MTEEISPSKDKNIFQSLNDFLTDIWKGDELRPWDHYIKEQKFRYFWDDKEQVKK